MRDIVTLKAIFTLLASLLLILLSGSLANAIEISVSTDKVGLSEHLDLDASTHLEGRTVLDDNNIHHSLEAMGSGKNNMQANVRGDGYTVTNKLRSTGEFLTSVSFIASTDSATLRQDHQLKGKEGYVAADAITSANEMHAEGFFRGLAGNISTSLVSTAGEKSLISGKMGISGIELLNEEISQGVADGRLKPVIVSGRFLSNDDRVLEFGFSFMNIVQD